jgi:predicted nucleic acid-binding protein
LYLNIVSLKFRISSNFIPISLNLEITEMLPEIKLPELHDRIIVATAKILGAKLITKDKDIVESGLVETIWV